MKSKKSSKPQQFLFMFTLLLLAYCFGIRFYKYSSWKDVTFNLLFNKPICRQINVNVEAQSLFGQMQYSDSIEIIDASTDQLVLQIPAGTKTISLQFCPNQEIQAQKIWLASGIKMINYALPARNNSVVFTRIDSNTEYFYHRILRIRDYYYYFGLALIFICLVWNIVFSKPRSLIVLSTIIISIYTTISDPNLVQFLQPTGYNSSGIIAHSQHTDSSFIADLINICLLISFPSICYLALSYYDHDK